MIRRRPPLVHLAPIAPAGTGNGLAMRNRLFRTAASHDFDVTVVVVPVAGEVDSVDTDACTMVRTETGSRSRGIGSLLADPRWRARLTDTVPLPAMARRAPPMLAVDVAATLAGGAPVHVARSYLAPLGVALAERLGSPWVSLDLDDDDEELARALGDPAEADAYARLVRTFGPLFGGVALAAPAEADAVGTRHGLTTTVVPNAVHPPAGRPRRPDRFAGPVSVLLVGNLTYRPNAEAARRLVDDVLPRLRARLGDRPVRLTLVGAAAPAVRALDDPPAVRVTGFVPDLAAHYAGADVVVAPITDGGGTRIKLLEAFSHGLPVVTTATGAAGLAVRHEVHLLVADTADEIARQVARVVTDRGLALRLSRAAEHLVRSTYSYDAVVPRIRDFFRSAAGAC